MAYLLSQPSKSTAFSAILLAVLLITPIATGGGGTVIVTQTGTSSNSFAQGADISNTVTVNFPTAYHTVPTLICCAFTSGFAGLQPNALSWSTVFVPQQIRNSTNPTFDVSARHDQNNSTCSPCTNKVTITPSGLDEIILVHLFYISDVAITVSSVTSPGLAFTPQQPFGAGSGDEVWTTTTFTTSPITITVTFSAPSSTIVTTSVIATAFANTVQVFFSASGTSVTSPVTVANTGPLPQFITIVGDSFLTNAGVACSDPTPGSGQTQILNANTFCATNTNGGVGFLYNYDVEYFNTNTQASYNYLTNFNGTVGTGLSINLQLIGGAHHDRLWSITGSTTNSTLYNTEQFDTSLNPPFQSQAGVANQAGRFNFVCNYANENVSLAMNVQFGSVTGPGTPFTTSIIFNVGFSGKVCDGNIHTFTIQNSYALADNYIGRVVASCTCASTLQISISNMFIGWRMIGQIQIRESIAMLTATTFQVKWLASFPTPTAFSVTWSWSAIGS